MGTEEGDYHYCREHLNQRDRTLKLQGRAEGIAAVEKELLITQDFGNLQKRTASGEETWVFMHRHPEGKKDEYCNGCRLEKAISAAKGRG